MGRNTTMLGKKVKILFWTVPFLIAGIVGAFPFFHQTTVLNDGTKVTLAGVTFGRHHEFPGQSTGAGLRIMSFNTTNDTMCVWLRHEKGRGRGHRPHLNLQVCDVAETACVGSSPGVLQQPGDEPNEELIGFKFPVYPRRDPKIKLRFQEWNTNGQPALSKAAFIISNPARDSFARWPAESLPITQKTEDLDVTLTRLVYGVPFGGYRTLDKKDPMAQGVLAAFRFEQNGQTVTNWQPVKIETADATGNKLSNSSGSNRRENGEVVMVYQWGLWPDEPAWKLRVEFSRTSGFADADCWTVKDVPIEPGNNRDYRPYDETTPSFAETTNGGIHLKIYSVKRFEHNHVVGNDDQLRIWASSPLDGRRLTVVKITDDQNREIYKYDRNSGDGEYNYGLMKLGAAKTINVTVALPRSRIAEFTVKPAKFTNSVPAQPVPQRIKL